jgi:hypothetical protein
LLVEHVAGFTGNRLRHSLFVRGGTPVVHQAGFKSRNFIGFH